MTDAPEEDRASTFEEIVRHAIGLFAPALASHEAEICDLVAEWIETGAARQRWPDWADRVPRERREAIGLRVHAWLAWRRNERDYLELIDSPTIAPVVEVATDEGCCAKARGMAGRYYAIDGMPVVPLAECRKTICRCHLRRFQHRDFDPTGETRVTIVRRRPTKNGVIAEIALEPRRR